jgi:tetratricopeptide (TPR) repeat protein
VFALAWVHFASAGSVDELLRSGARHEAEGDDPLAARRYSEALELDGTAAEAYLRLGALRLRTGDAREAVRVYSVALARLPGFAEGRRARALAEWALGAREDAERDMEDYLLVRPSDASSARQLSDWYATHGRFAPQLALWRRRLTQAQGDDRVEARAMVMALQALLREVDPVTAPEPPLDPTRRALAHIAHRSSP